MNLICYIFPLVVSVVLLVMGRLGKCDNQICWVKYMDEDKSTKETNMKIGFNVFYTPLYFCWAYCIVVYILIKIKIGKITNLEKYPTVKMLKNYPAMLFICYLNGTLMRIFDIL